MMSLLREIEVSAQLASGPGARDRPGRTL